MNDVNADCGLFGPGFYGNKRVVSCWSKISCFKSVGHLHFSVGRSRMDVPQNVVDEDWIEPTMANEKAKK